MANEFDFLRTRWPKLAALGADASRLVDISPVTALASLRDYCEWAADISLDLLDNPMAPDTDQMERLSAMKAMGSVPPEILEKFHNIRTTEDSMSTSPLGNPDEARARMEDAVDIGRWLMRQEGGRPQPAGRTASVNFQTGRQQPVTYTTSQVRVNPEDDPYTTGRRAPAHGTAPADDYDDYDSYRRERDGDRNIGAKVTEWVSGFADRYKQYLTAPVIISAALVVVLLIVLITLLSKCAGNSAAKNVTTPTLTENFSILITATPAPATTPAPVQVVKYLDEFTDAEISKSHAEWTTYYLGKWNASSHTGNFSIFNGMTGDDAKGVLYEHGLAWFIKSGEFERTEDRRALTFTTNGLYDTFIFDMGVEKEWCFEDAADCGSYSIQVFVDGSDSPVYTSDKVNYSYYKNNIQVNVKGAQSVKVRLVEEKGSKGSLNVVLGDARFVGSSSNALTTTTTTAAGETTTTTTAAQ